MKKIIPLLSLALLTGSLASCSGNGSSSVANKDKPLVFFNRQPSNPETGEIDMKTMNFSDKTIYVGFDAAAGGDVQGKMITDYLKTKTKAELDKNSDGILGYVLAVGDEGHNDSKARTKGVRKALGTLKDDSTAAGPDNTKEGTVEVKDGTLKVKEIASKAMTGSDGSTWNAGAATEAFTTWAGQLSTQIDLAISNNDGMAKGFTSSTSWSQINCPIFGYDANEDVLKDIKDGKFTGTITQNVDAQAAGVLQVIRNLCDGLSFADSIKKGFSEADQYGNKISASMTYNDATKALLASNTAVTKDNIESYYSASGIQRDSGIKKVPDTAKQLNIWLDYYNGTDTFLSTSYKPALNYYANLLNIKVNTKEGDGQSEDSVANAFNNLSNYDAYAINMVKTNSGSTYTDKII